MYMSRTSTHTDTHPHSQNIPRRFGHHLVAASANNHSAKGAARSGLGTAHKRPRHSPTKARAHSCTQTHRHANTPNTERHIDTETQRHRESTTKRRIPLCWGCFPRPSASLPGRPHHGCTPERPRHCPQVASALPLSGPRDFAPITRHATSTPPSSGLGTPPLAHPKAAPSLHPGGLGVPCLIVVSGAP